jgi:hypothetical protein
MSEFDEGNATVVAADTGIREEVFITGAKDSIEDYSAKGDITVFLAEEPEEPAAFLNSYNVLIGKALADLGIKAPFTLNLGDDLKDTGDTDVSTYWGYKFTERMRKVIAKHNNLFRTELGLFNDDVDMPIPFRDETDVLGLK